MTDLQKLFRTLDALEEAGEMLEMIDDRCYEASARIEEDRLWWRIEKNIEEENWEAFKKPEEPEPNRGDGTWIKRYGHSYWIPPQ